eukprot:8168292-Pyramimonas_sp.AAC.2
MTTRRSRRGPQQLAPNLARRSPLSLGLALRAARPYARARHGRRGILTVKTLPRRLVTREFDSPVEFSRGSNVRVESPSKPSSDSLRVAVRKRGG